MRLVGEGAVIERHHEQHRADADHDGVHLGQGHPRRGAGRIGGRAVDHGDAQRAQREDRNHQRPVDVVIQSSFEHYGTKFALNCGFSGSGRPSFFAKNVSST